MGCYISVWSEVKNRTEFNQLKKKFEKSVLNSSEVDYNFENVEEETKRELDELIKEKRTRENLPYYKVQYYDIFYYEKKIQKCKERMEKMKQGELSKFHFRYGGNTNWGGYRNMCEKMDSFLLKLSKRHPKPIYWGGESDEENISVYNNGKKKLINKEDDEPFSERIFKMGFLILVVGGLLVLVYNVMKLMYSAGVLWSENVRIVVTIVLSLAVGMGWMCVVYIVMDNLDVINRKIAKIKQKIKTIFS